jgi:TfoX/Sxy family transcriptional regulator of competence genes
MAYSEQLAERIRSYLAPLAGVEEKEMMGGLTFMLNGKMCVGIVKDELMCRIDPERYEEALERPGCRAMDFTKRPMAGFIFVDDTGLRKAADFVYFMDLAIAFNPKAKATKKK